MRGGFGTLSGISLVAFGALASTCTLDSDANDGSVGTEEASQAGEYESPVATTSVDTASSPEATAAGQDIDIPAFQDHDLDRDGSLRRDEFAAWIPEAGVYASWVYEAEGDLNVDGVSRRMVTVWDEDGNSLLTEAEWSAGVGSWFGPDDHGAYPDWDADGDGGLNLDEVSAALDRRGLYGRIDLDGDASIDDEELANWLFDVIDTNGDGRLAPTEWDAATERSWIG